LPPKPADIELAAVVRIAYKVRAMRSQTRIVRREESARAVLEGVRDPAAEGPPFRDRISAEMD